MFRFIRTKLKDRNFTLWSITNDVSFSGMEVGMYFTRLIKTGKCRSFMRFIYSTYHNNVAKY